MPEEDDGFYSLDQLLLEEGNATEDEPKRSEIQGQTSGARYRQKSDLTLAEKRNIVNQLLIHLKGDNMPRGFQTQLATAIGVHRSTVCRICKDIKKQRENGEVIDVRSKKIGAVGRKPKEYDEEWLQSVPLTLRTTIRAFAGALKVDPFTVYRLLKKGKLRSHTSSNNSTVTENHKLARMAWVLKHIHPGSHGRNAQFDEMKNIIHIDEKWFYLNPDMRRFYLLPREDDPYRCTQSKRFNIKLMFIGVVSRPIFDEMGVMIHDGKFGIYPFAFKQRTKYNSKNKKKGTLETKAIQNVKKEVIRRMIIDKVIPGIMEKWPQCLSKTIFIKQDNARPHIQPTDPEFMEAATANGFNIQLMFQPPPPSPSPNVLDLGLFNSFQSLQYQSFPKNVDELIEKVEEVYANYDPNLMKHCWLQLQYVMIEILKVKGGNNYKNPHHAKRRMERLGILPQNVEIPQSLVDEAVQASI